MSVIGDITNLSDPYSQSLRAFLKGGPLRRKLRNIVSGK